MPRRLTVPLVDVVVVAWNHGRWIRACVASIEALLCERTTVARVFVVDNASTTPVRTVLDPSTRCTVLTNATNRGFAAACNQAAARGEADFILFLNPDTRIHPDALARAMAVLEAPSGGQIGIVGLRLTDAGGVTQRRCGRFPGLLDIVSRTLGLSRIAPALVGGVRLMEWPHDASRDVDFACGAALLVRRDMFEALGFSGDQGRRDLTHLLCEAAVEGVDQGISHLALFVSDEHPGSKWLVDLADAVDTYAICAPILERPAPPPGPIYVDHVIS